MKIYTRTGDDGTTGLLGGQRVPKSDPRLECYGTVDELNACLGLACTAMQDEKLENLIHQIQEVQRDLFTLGSHLAAPENDPVAKKWLPPLDETIVARLEMQIDQATEQLDPLRNFILPGGTEASARLHLARTICRRAERRVSDFAADRPVAPLILTYLNRLSDWLFIQARRANHLAGVNDIPWKRE